MQKEKSSINCSSFQKHEPKIKALTDRINQVRVPQEKIKHAEGLLEESCQLLDCPDYKEGDLNCSNCRTIANLRKQTAELIIKTRKLI